MTEWWTYGLSDFLMFSPQVHARLLERYNAALWPAQVAALAVGVFVAWAAARGAGSAQRVALLLLAVGWGWIGWGFAWQRYAEIFLGGQPLAWVCWLLAVLLVVAAAWGRSAARSNIGAAFVAAAVLYPVLAPITGRPWLQAEVIGLMPDPTALATIGVLLAVRLSWLSWLPAAILLLGLATRWTLAQ